MATIAQMAGGVLLASLFLLMRDVVLFATYGLSSIKDTYDAAATVPDLIFFLTSGGALATALTPLLAAQLGASDEWEANRTFTAILRTTSLGMVGLSTLGAVFAGIIGEVVFPAVTDQSTLVGLMRWLLVAQVFLGTGGLLAAATQARTRSAIPTVTPLVHLMAMLVGGALWHAQAGGGPTAFAKGEVIGSVAGFALQAAAAAWAGVKFDWSTPWSQRAMGPYYRFAGPLMVGQSLLAADVFWPRLAGQFAGEGAIGALTGARDLVAMGAGVLAFSTGVTTVLALQNRDRDREGVEQTYVTFRLWLTIAGVGAAMTMALAFPLVRVLFRHGSFDASAAETVSTLVLFYTLGVPSAVAQTTYAQALMTLDDRWRPVRLVAASTGVSAAVVAILTKLMGSSGVALGSVLATTAAAVALGRAWHSGDRGRVVEGIGGDLARIAFATAAAGILGVLLVGLATRLLVPDPIATILGAVMVAAAFVIVARTTGSPEAQAIWEMLAGSSDARHRRRNRRASGRTHQPL